jgi:hypothetical protein
MPGYRSVFRTYGDFVPGIVGDHMKRLLCCALIALLAGCIPIGIRGSSQLAAAATTDARPTL